MNREAKKLLKKNNESEKQILKENNNVYTDMIVYLRGADITEYYQEKVREDLIEMIVSGQERGDDIKKVMGENYKEICDEIIEEMPKKTMGQKVMDVITMTLDIIWILGIIYVIRTVGSNLLSDNESWYLNVGLGELISNAVVVVAANVIVNYVCKTAFSKKVKKSSKVTSFIITWIVFCLIGCAIILPAILLTKTLFTVHIGVAVLALVVTFFVSKVLKMMY